MENTTSNFIVLKEKKSLYGMIELRSDNILVFRPDIHTFKEYDLEILKNLHIDFLEITEGVPRPYMSDNRFITGFIIKHFHSEYLSPAFCIRSVQYI